MQSTKTTDFIGHIAPFCCGNNLMVSSWLAITYQLQCDQTLPLCERCSLEDEVQPLRGVATIFYKWNVSHYVMLKARSKNTLSLIYRLEKVEQKYAANMYIGELE